MKKKILLIALLMMICISNFTIAQITFQRTYGGTIGEIGYSVQQTFDGGYIIAGYTASFGASPGDIYLIKTNAYGDTLWTKTYGGTGSESANYVQQTTDGGYIIVGNTNSFGAGDADIYLIKINAIGDTLWTKTFEGTGDDEGYSVQQTADGGYIVVGITNSFGSGNYDVYLIKTTSNGNIIWTKTYGGPYNVIGISVQQTTDGGYIMTGYGTFNSGRPETYLLKTTAIGDTLWTKTYGGLDYHWGYKVQQTSDGGYIIAGVIENYLNNLNDVFLLKTTATGDTVWKKIYKMTGYAYQPSIQQTTDSGYIIGISEHISSSLVNAYLIKTTSTGNTVWAKIYGGAGDNILSSVQQTIDGGYITVGSKAIDTASIHKIYLIKTDANGNSGCNEVNTTILTNRTVTQLTSPTIFINSVAFTVSNPATIIGHGACTSTTLCLFTGISELSPNSQNINVYPNPVQNEINISLQPNSKAAFIRIYNSYGALVREALLNKDATTVSVSELAEGLYLYQITDNNNTIINTGKIIKE